MTVALDDNPSPGETWLTIYGTKVTIHGDADEFGCYPCLPIRHRHKFWQLLHRRELKRRVRRHER